MWRLARVSIRAGSDRDQGTHRQQSSRFASQYGNHAAALERYAARNKVALADGGSNGSAVAGFPARCSHISSITRAGLPGALHDAPLVSSGPQIRSAATIADRFGSSVDDGAFTLIEYGDGLAARLCADATTAVESYTCAVHGEKRTAVASGPTLIDLTLYTADPERSTSSSVSRRRIAPLPSSTKTFRS